MKLIERLCDCLPVGGALLASYGMVHLLSRIQNRDALLTGLAVGAAAVVGYLLGTLARWPVAMMLFRHRR